MSFPDRRPLAVLTIAQTAFLLRLPEDEVRRRLVDGRIGAAKAGRRSAVDAAAVAILLRDDPLALLVLDGVRARALRTPRAASPRETPPPMSVLTRRLPLLRTRPTDAPG